MDLNEQAKQASLGIAGQFNKMKQGASFGLRHAAQQLSEDAGKGAAIMNDPRMAGIGLGPEAAVMGKGFGLVGSLLKPLGQVGEANKAASNYAKWLEQVTLRMKQEGLGQQVLDELDEVGKSPQSVVAEFWKHTYPHLPEEAQQRFNTYINKVTGFKPGSVIAAGANGERIVGKTWDELYPADYVPSAVEHLEGTERGLIALMEMGNRRRVADGQAVNIVPRSIEEKR